MKLSTAGRGLHPSRLQGLGLLVLALFLLSCAPFGPGRRPGPTAFAVHQPDPGFVPPPIVLQHDSETGTGADWEKVKQPQWFEGTPAVRLGRAANHLREGLLKMTGREFPVLSTNDLSRGIVLTLLAGASEDIRNDPAARRALAPDPKDQYAANEAFYIRSESNRVLVVANTPDGLCAGVVDLLESVDYEVLGMGPDWIHVPDHRTRALAFAVDRAGRPTFYIRGLTPTSGQSYGVGTIMGGLTDPADEPVYVSYTRWAIGTRMYGSSMPGFPGHALQAYHRRVIDRMRETGATEGFLVPKAVAAPAAQRPAAAADNQGWLWINADTTGPHTNEVYLSDGKTWSKQNLLSIGANLDLSVPFVREILRASLVNQATNSLAKDPDGLVIFAIDAEDGGGYAVLDTLMKYQSWYPDYLAQQGVPFGRPFVLHGHNGLNQPRETWDPAAASDTMFGTANWLLREFDQWVDSLPADQQVTATGQKIKDRVRCSFYSYNYHDVPPNFNVDPRVRVMIASYPKHRGRGKWEKFASQEDMARAFKVMLPREPSGDYRIISLSYYWDPGPSGIPAGWNASAAAIAADYRRAFDAGYRAINIETDFNFGKFGLGYWLITKMLWNAELTAADLDALRDRWLRRAFGSAWQEMKDYYDFMLTENYPVNGPNSWAKAIRLIDAASRKIDGGRESAARRRIDDVKEYWYYHYLLDSGKYTKDSPEVKEYLWKGQMSYMVALHVVARRTFKTNSAKDAVGPELSAGPAHYTRAETAAWWAKVLEHWPLTPVTMFTDATLANGTPARGVDVNDLVAVQEFRTDQSDQPFIYNSGYQTPVPFLMVARQKEDPIGFKLSWPFNPNDNYYVAKKLPYGVDIWDPVQKVWEPWVDKTMIVQQSVAVTNAQGGVIQVVDVQLKAPRAGTYRFDIGYGGNASSLASCVYDPVTGKHAAPVGFTYFTGAEGHTQSPVYLYIPKGTKSLDLEVWDTYGNKFLHLYQGLPAAKPALSRKVDISKMGTHTIALEPGEDGAVAMISANGFAFPFLYSVPTLWAKCPAVLLVPRAIAEADGLTIVPGTKTSNR
ncbi:hypothetical protein HQ590_05890 [bacterium]|nr:hypothetical protein [bacterium]